MGSTMEHELRQCLECGGLCLLFHRVIVIHLEEKGGRRVREGWGFRGDGGGLVRLGIDDIERFQVAEMVSETKVCFAVLLAHHQERQAERGWMVCWGEGSGRRR